MEGITYLGWEHWGLVGLMCCAIILILFFVIRWVLTYMSKLMENFNKEREKWFEIFRDEREKWSEIFNVLNGNVQQQNSALKEFRDQVKDAHSYQKQEHEKLIDQAGKVCGSLKQIEEALGRINGYRKKE